jgi:hypothetical protein
MENSISDRYRPGSSRRVSGNNPYTPNSPNLPEATAPYTPDTSKFYRPPRSHNGRVSSYEYESANSDSILSAIESTESAQTHSSSSQNSSNAFDELLQLPSKSGVDYSVRESDMYYGRRHGDPGPSQNPLTESTGEDQSSRQTFFNLKRSSAERFKLKKAKEKGFQVMRPPRPG